MLLAEAEKGGRMKSRKNIREFRHAELDDNKQRLLKVIAALKLVRKFAQKNNLAEH